MVQLKLNQIQHGESSIYIFQFHNGTIKTPRHQTHQIKMKDFNSIMVQLKQHHVRAVLQLLFYFNSIMVQLKLIRIVVNMYVDAHFNSIMVQLKLIAVLIYSELLSLFQFHNGTIKTLLQVTMLALWQNFNSIMVQLKPCAFLSFHISCKFQFHNGTIKTD